MIAAAINRFGKPDVFEIKEMPIPIATGYEVLVKIFASSINPIDFKSRKGNHKYILGSHFPIILGYDMAGEVVKAGNKVTRFKKGDKVFGRSDQKYGRTYAQYGITSEKTLALMPKNATYEQAAAMPLAGLTSLQALRDKCEIKEGQKILINGATGGVGHFAVQLVKYFGGKSSAVCSSLHNGFIKSLNPDIIIDYTKEDFKNKNEKYDIIFDVAGKETYLTCRHLLYKNGIYCTTLPRPKILLHYFVSLFNNGRIKTLLMKARYMDLEYVAKLFDENILIPNIDKVFPLEEITKAHEYAEHGHTEGKIVISIKHG